MLQLLHYPDLDSIRLRAPSGPSVSPYPSSHSPSSLHTLLPPHQAFHTLQEVRSRRKKQKAEGRRRNICPRLVTLCVYSPATPPLKPLPAVPPLLQPPPLPTTPWVLLPSRYAPLALPPPPSLLSPQLSSSLASVEVTATELVWRHQDQALDLRGQCEARLGEWVTMEYQVGDLLLLLTMVWQGEEDQQEELVEDDTLGSQQVGGSAPPPLLAGAWPSSLSTSA